MADRKLLRLSATLVFIGQLVYWVLKFLHPRGGNDHQAAFTTYANSSSWAAIHLGLFVATAVVLAGLLVLFFALGVLQGTLRWLGFFGALAAGVSLALASVDGVALKQAVDAWASAPAAEQATRFASAQAIRWLELGTSSYLDYMLGLALVLFAIVIVWTARVTRPIGYLMGVSGLTYFMQGWIIGTTGFTSARTVPTDAGYTLLFASMIWLLVATWRRKELVQAVPA